MSPSGSDRTPASAEIRRFRRLDPDTQRLLLRVAEHLAAITHGTVEIVTQDRRVVQISTSEKIRLR